VPRDTEYNEVSCAWRVGRGALSWTIGCGRL